MITYSLSNIKKIYYGSTVLNINSMEIKKGLIYALSGPNGAGKTTLLNILSFLERPTEGEVVFNKKRVRFSEVKLQKLRKKVVILDQHPILFSTTVRKNIEFGLKIRKIALKERKVIIKKTLELVGMEKFIDTSAVSLSGGETQRVALARVIALSPEVLLCDEPTSSVDIENQTIVINALKKINKHQGITIIFTSHDKEQTESLANKIFFMEHGKLI